MYTHDKPYTLVILERFQSASVQVQTIPCRSQNKHLSRLRFSRHTLSRPTTKHSIRANCYTIGSPLKIRIIIKKKITHSSLNDQHLHEISETSSIEELIQSYGINAYSFERKEGRKKKRLKTKLEEDREQNKRKHDVCKDEYRGHFIRYTGSQHQDP